MMTRRLHTLPFVLAVALAAHTAPECGATQKGPYEAGTFVKP